jgi:hypothetical protein
MCGEAGTEIQTQSMMLIRIDSKARVTYDKRNNIFQIIF